MAASLVVTHKVLYSCGDVNFLVGSVPFIIGSALSNADPGRHFQTSAINFVVGSAMFLSGSVFKLLDSVWELMLLGRYTAYVILYILAGLSWTVGGILFTIGSIFFESQKNNEGVIIWTVGGSAFMVGTTFQLFADEYALSRMDPNRNNTNRWDRISRWSMMISTNWYFVGAILFLVGSIVFVPNRPDLNYVGNLLWIVGSSAFIVGALFSIVGIMVE